MPKSRKPFDFWIFIIVLILTALGIIMVFSASAPFAYSTYKDVYYILKSQLLYAALGIVVMIAAINTDFKIIARFAPALLAISLFLLIVVLIPGIGHEENGAYRWIYLGPFHFQPSEVAKLSIIIFFASSLTKRKERIGFFFRGLLPYLFLMAVFTVLLVLEPHMSCTLIMLTVCIIILLVAGAKARHFLIPGIPAAIALAAIIAFEPYMRARVLSFLNPWNDLQGDGYQAVQSLYAIGSGGLFGRGLGRSMQKFLYLPYPHNDFIFSVLAEELGFIGVFAVLTLFLIFIWRGIKVGINSSSLLGSLMAIGITSLISVQVLMNVAVVTSSMPPTGVSLPFFSYGGTSLILFLAEAGILLNISRQSSYERI